MPIMKALTIRSPWWAWMLPQHYAAKRIENRNWWTAYRGPVLIHVSKFWDLDAIKLDMASARVMARDAGWPGGNPPSPWQPDIALTIDDMKPYLGRCVAVAEIAGCVRDHPSPWFVGKFGFDLRTVRPLKNPFAVRGIPGFFPVDVSAEQLL